MPLLGCLLALALGGPALSPASPGPARVRESASLRSDDDGAEGEPPAAPAGRLPEDEPVYSEEPPRWIALAWGGAGFILGSNSSTLPLGGLQVSRSFAQADLGLMAQGHYLGRNESVHWAPSLLFRIDEHFQTYRGVGASLSLALGGGKVGKKLDDLTLWYLFALGVRVSEGPFLYGGELGFEQGNLLRLAACFGLRF